MLQVLSHEQRDVTSGSHISHQQGVKWCGALVLALSHGGEFHEKAFGQRCINQTGYLLLSFDKTQHNG